MTRKNISKIITLTKQKRKNKENLIKIKNHKYTYIQKCEKKYIFLGDISAVGYKPKS